MLKIVDSKKLIFKALGMGHGILIIQVSQTRSLKLDLNWIIANELCPKFSTNEDILCERY